MDLSVKEKEKQKLERNIEHYNKVHKEVDGTTYKQCSICEEWFPCTDEYFYKNKCNHTDELNPYCKPCTINKYHKWYTDNGGRSSTNGKIYRDGHKKERKEWHKRYYIETKEDHQKYLKNWQENNPEKLKGYGELYSNKKHNITTQEWINCKEYFNNQCAYCGLPIEDHYFTRKEITKNGDFHKEHVNCEGEGSLSKCVPSCKTCNTSKHKDIMEEWYAKKEFYSKEKLDKIYQWMDRDYKIYELPYIIKKSKNLDNNTFSFELWSKDSDGNCETHLATENKKRKLDIHIQEYFGDKG